MYINNLQIYLSSLSLISTLLKKKRTKDLLKHIISVLCMIYASNLNIIHRLLISPSFRYILIFNNPHLRNSLNHRANLLNLHHQLVVSDVQYYLLLGLLGTHYYPSSAVYRPNGLRNQPIDYKLSIVLLKFPVQRLPPTIVLSCKSFTITFSANGICLHSNNMENKLYCQLDRIFVPLIQLILPFFLSPY